MGKTAKGRPAGKRSANPTIRKVRQTLKGIAESKPTSFLEEAETYVCAVCDLPLKLCLADPARCCSTKLLEGTELQLLRRSQKEGDARCISCGSVIPKRVLRRNPLAELCPACQPTSLMPKHPKRSKGVKS
jgi:hypothetical protein